MEQKKRYLQNRSEIGFNNSLGKLPPQAIDVEEAILGAIMIESECINEVLEIIRDPEVFYKESHRIMFEAIVELINDSEPVDILTVTEKLRKSGKLEKCGGAYAVTELTIKVNSSANIHSHCLLVLEKSIKRSMIKMGSELQERGYNEIEDAFDSLSEANSLLTRLNDSIDRKRAKSFAAGIQEAMNQVYAAMTSKSNITGIPSGFHDLDVVTHGWQKSDLIIIAARPSMGKTAFVLNVARNAAIKYKVPLAIFSLEMATIQLIMRIQSAECEIFIENIRSGKMPDHEYEKLSHMSNSISNAPIHIDDTSGISVIELKAKVSNLIKKYGIQMIIIDYLQLMVGKGENRTQEIGKISRALKGIAKEFNIPVIALSQLSRAVETRGGDKRPQLSDLRESGDIEQDADIVIFLYRPEYYGITEDEEGNSTQGLCEAIIAKHRNGRLANIPFKFNGNIQKFFDYNLHYQEVEPRNANF